MDDPWLASNFGGDPSELVGDERATNRKNEYPQQPPGPVEIATPKQKARQHREADKGRTEPDHDVVARKRHQDRRPVLQAEAIEAHHRFLEILVNEKAQTSWDCDVETNGLGRVVGQAKETHGGGSRLVVALEGSELGGLPVVDVFGLQVSRRQCGQRGDGGEEEGSREALLCEVDVATLEQIPGRDRHHKEGAQNERSDPHVNQPVNSRRVEDQGPEVYDLGAQDRHTIDDQRPPVAQHGHDVVPGRGLLPAVGDHNPDRRENRTERHHQSREKVHPRRNSVPPEDQQGQESGLEEESEDTLGRQC